MRQAFRDSEAQQARLRALLAEALTQMETLQQAKTQDAAMLDRCVSASVVRLGCVYALVVWGCCATSACRRSTNSPHTPCAPHAAPRQTNSVTQTLREKEAGWTQALQGSTQAAAALQAQLRDAEAAQQELQAQLTQMAGTQVRAWVACATTSHSSNLCVHIRRVRLLPAR